MPPFPGKRLSPKRVCGHLGSLMHQPRGHEDQDSAASVCQPPILRSGLSRQSEDLNPDSQAGSLYGPNSPSYIMYLPGTHANKTL